MPFTLGENGLIILNINKLNLTKISHLGYHEEKAQSTDSHKTARTL